MKCSCVILNYNDAERCMAMVERIHDYPSIARIVLVDGGSTDGSAAKLAPLATMEGVELLVLDRNGGYGFGNNRGVEYCLKHPLGYERELVLVANPDTNFPSQTVDELIACIQKDANAIACAPVQYTDDGKLVEGSAWPLPTAEQYAAVDSVLWSRVLRVPGYDVERYKSGEAMRVDCVAGACVLLDAHKFAAVGMYHEDMFLYCEESSLGLRARRAGYSSYLCTKASYTHTHGATTGKSLKNYMTRYTELAKSRRYVVENDYKVEGARRMLCRALLGAADLEARIKSLYWSARTK